MDDLHQLRGNFASEPSEDAKVASESTAPGETTGATALPAHPTAWAKSRPEIFMLSRCEFRFLIKQTCTAVFLNAIFSAIAVSVNFRHLATVPISGSPSLIADSIFQTFITTLMSILPPSIMTAKWMRTRGNLTTDKTSTARILIRALSAALIACLVSAMVLPFAMPRVFSASLPFQNMLLLKCLYGIAIGLAVTPFAVATVMRGSRRGESAKSIDSH